jgi:ketosteroid isomerase-like protein
MPPRHLSRSVESSSSPARNHVALVQRGISLWNQRDFAAALEDLDPDIEWRTSGVVPGIEEVYLGHEGVTRFWKTWTETWEDIQIDTEELVERDKDVFVFARFRARGRDGLEVDQPVAFQFTSGDVGLLTRFQAYWNRDDLPVDIRTSHGSPE